MIKPLTFVLVLIINVQLIFLFSFLSVANLFEELQINLELLIMCHICYSWYIEQFIKSACLLMLYT